MIINIPNLTYDSFTKIFKDINLTLPKRWDGGNFARELNSQFNYYINNLIRENIQNSDIDTIKKICKKLIVVINSYYDGMTNKSYKQFSELLNQLYSYPLALYRKNGWTEAFDQDDPLSLYRVRCVSDDKNYPRKDIFHTPYNLRSKVPTCRYSIAGYPSLYLATTLMLCCVELGIESKRVKVITSKFKINRNYSDVESYIDVLDLSIKPQDFFKMFNSEQRNSINYPFSNVLPSDERIYARYLLWYPLILCCSYIRINKSDPFASEYIIPQMLMQWARERYNRNHIIGFRYFSCASEMASDLGYNYVFPTSGNGISNDNVFCPILSKAFHLTNPRFIHEYMNISECQMVLENDRDLDTI